MNLFKSPPSGVHLASPEQSARIAVLLKALTTALHDPAHNPVTMLVILGIAGVVLLLVLATVVLVVQVVEDWRDPPPPPVRTEHVARRKREGFSVAAAVAWALVIAAAVVGVGAGYRYSISDASCARCHFTKHAFVSRASDTAHAKVACARCHVAPGASGAFAAAVSGTGNLATQLLHPPADNPSAEARVQNGACLSCHQPITARVVVAGGMRMRHSDVLAAGYACTDCHSTAGHGARAAQVRYPTMAQCVQCHDGTKAPSACPTCHSRDVGAQSGERAASVDIPKATITVDGCRGCHQMKTCIDCHGIELPHSQLFIGGYHARKALLEPQVCIKCHSVSTFCNGCHQFTVGAGGLPAAPHGTPAQFISDHAKVGPTTGGGDSASCSCHTKGGARQQLCDYCHAKQPDR